jgi:hypothetical protein
VQHRMIGVKKRNRGIVTAELSSGVDLKHRIDRKSSGIYNVFSRLTSNAPDLSTLCELRTRRESRDAQMGVNRGRDDHQMLGGQLT